MSMHPSHLPRWKLVVPGESRVIEGCIMISHKHLMISLDTPDQRGMLPIADSTSLRIPAGMGTSHIFLRPAGNQFPGQFQYRKVDSPHAPWVAIYIVRPLQ